MMNEQVAAVIENTAKFSENLSLDTPDVRGLFSNDGSYSYFYDGPLLRAFSSNGASVGQFDFSKLPTFKPSADSPVDVAPSILCVAPFNRVNVLVGLEDGSGKGQIYLVNVVFGKILRSFAVPFAVTSVETIHGDSNCAGLPYISAGLQTFSGIIACGTKNGQIYIIDMALDQEVVTQPAFQLHCVDIHKEENLPNRKRLIADKHEVLCYSLAFRESTEYFTYMSAACEVLHYAKYDEVYISSLKFLPQLGSLCVGYNFGSYQLWRLDLLTLDYSSPLGASSLPVSHFAYMEPENDPRSFCYLWVMKCSSLASIATLCDSMQEDLAGAEAGASLYQLAYEQKTFTVAGLPLFKDLMQVGCALKHRLAPEEDVITSWVVSCDTLTNIKSLRSAEDDSQIGTMSTDAYLTMVSWRVRYTDGSVTSHLALFDINRWYHAQMPKQIRWFDGWCSYFSQYSFDDAVNDKACAGVYLDPASISCYKCPRLSQLERFQFPASLRFAVKILLSSGIVSVQYNGVQRQSLLDVVNSSVECIAEPQAAFQLLRSAGLIPQNTADKVTQRKAVLTTLLLHTHTEFIAKCFEEFSTADSSDPSVESLMTWLWERLERVIQQFDNSCVALYDWSGAWIDNSVRHVLLSCITQTKNIVNLLKHLCFLKEQSPQLKLGSLMDKLSVAEMRLLHMRLVWWCLNRGLLPEMGESDTATSGGFSYPATTLRRSYNNRHSELLVSSSESGTELMVDVLANNFGPQLRETLEMEGGRGLYPPGSIKALLDTFLLDTPLPHKLLYFVYMMLDLMALVNTEVNESLSSHTHSLLASIESGKDNSSLSSLALAFWSLDHMEYEDVITALEQPGAMLYLTADVTRKMLSRLLDQGQPKVALSMVSLVSLHCTHSVSGELLIAVYLANGMLPAAVDVSRGYSSGLKLFQKVLSNLKSSRELSDLLCLPLTQKELECVRQHLEEKGDLDKLVVHYLQTGNLVEAVQLNKALNSQPLWKGDFKAKERAMTRDRLVKWQLSLLPPIQKKLLEDPKYLQLPTKRKTIRPQAQRRGFFFGSREPKLLAPVEIAHMVMEREPVISLQQKPFIQNLSSSVKKPSKSSALSSLKEKASQSITGLFDSPALSRRSSSKRRAESADSVPAKRSFSDDSLLSWNEFKSLLRTPLVNRKSPKSRLLASAPVITPHSILKMRKPHFKMSPSPANYSGQFATTPKFNISTDTRPDTTCKSATRVKFEMDISDEELPPKAIDFNEDDSIMEQNDKENESDETSEIEFNMAAPLPQVITGAHKLAEEEQDDSFDSALSDLSPLRKVTDPCDEVKSNTPLVKPDSPRQEEQPLEENADRESPAPVLQGMHECSTPQTRKTKSVLSSPKLMRYSGSSADDSLRSLSSLDEEAQLCGLQLRVVREAAMKADKSFAFSPVTHVASPNEAREVDEAPINFSFSTPNPVESERRITRSASKSTRSSTKQLAHSETKTRPIDLAEPPARTSFEQPTMPMDTEYSAQLDKDTVEQKADVQSRVVLKPQIITEQELTGVVGDLEPVTVEGVIPCLEPQAAMEDRVCLEPQAVMEDRACLEPQAVMEDRVCLEPQAVMEDRVCLEPQAVMEDRVCLEPSGVKVLHGKSGESETHEEKQDNDVKKREELPEELTKSSASGLSDVVSSHPMVAGLQQAADTEAFVFSPATEVASRDTVIARDIVADEFTFATPKAADTTRRQTRSMKKTTQKKATPVQPSKEKACKSKADVGDRTGLDSSVSDDAVVSQLKNEQIPNQKHVLQDSSQHDFAFSPVTQVALPGTVDTQVEVSKKFEFAEPSSVTHGKRLKSKSLASVQEITENEQNEVTRVKQRLSQTRKPIKPVNIKLPEDPPQESPPSTSRVPRTRLSVEPKKPVKPVVIELPTQIFESTQVVATEETVLTSPGRVTRARSRKDSESSEHSIPPSPGRKSRSHRNSSATPESKKKTKPNKPSLPSIDEEASTRRTRLRSAPPDVDRLNVELTMEHESGAPPTPSGKTASTKKGRSRKTSTSSDTATKSISSPKKTSTKKSQKAIPEHRPTMRTRSSVKKPNVSPILSSSESSTKSAPQTRARRKL